MVLINLNMTVYPLLAPSIGLKTPFYTKPETNFGRASGGNQEFLKILRFSIRQSSTSRLGAMGSENPLTQQYAYQNAGRRTLLFL